MVIRKLLVYMFIALFMTMVAGFATTEQIRVEIEEAVDQEVIYNPLKFNGGVGIWADDNENQSHYNLTGTIRVTNQNPNGEDLGDIFVVINNTQEITLPKHVDGREGIFRINDTSAGDILLHIPQLRNGENSTWEYSINRSNIRPPLNMTSAYSASKALGGEPINVTDTLENTFDNATYQSNTCIYDIFVNQTTVPVDFSGVPQDFTFNTSSTNGSDGGNVSYASNTSQQWNVLGGGCLTLGNQEFIDYMVNTPLNIPETTHYTMINSTLSYSLNSSISQVTVGDIRGVGDASLSFDKEIIAPSDPFLHRSNVTWEVYGNVTTDAAINYLLEEVTFWVAKQPNGDPNTIDNDTITGTQPLITTENPNFVFNETSTWNSPQWLFNYSDLPSPIVYMDIDYTLEDDGVQLINRSITEDGKDIYIKELYLIIGYWLEIEKNITSIGDDEFLVQIDVHNRGNQVTPADSVVTIYDFVPSNYNVTSAFTYSSSPWYTTAMQEDNLTGQYNGTLYRWGLNPNNILNTSFAAGPDKNENTTWSVEFEVEGQGDYELLDVFVTGLDPLQVDGAGSTPTTIVTQTMERMSSVEGFFALTAGALLLLGLLL